MFENRAKSGSAMDPRPRESNPAEPASDPAAILGLDNVPLDLHLAGVGTRSLAIFFDSLVLVALTTSWWLLIVVLTNFADDPSSPWFWAVGLLGMFLLQWGYFSVCEILMGGRTPGKSLLSIQTVSHLGGRPSIGAIVIRNLLRSVDYLFGVFFMVIDPRSRRLGDMLASTLVVHRAEPLPADSFQLGRVPDFWTSREVMVVESFLRRAVRMESSVAQDLAGRLVTWIERKDPEFFRRAEPLPPELAEAEPLPPRAVPPNLHRLCALLAVKDLKASES